ncbi:putative PB1 domain, tetratricopeptide-like helical domain-containing protein [Rosa chinensis]|uniref:Putative PB1 domain, tetratricopeptide-like helical domain-containing protein n=1 Tax=Rosa chinensis TaxID=74649 RepID=A0A2P6RIK6_ROSCH|nr:protein PHOX4 [Rosa chinensis]PRQ46253.1 putative PB1 domain, tetratricopeptide-like helical domain-containing protein [Rosa chinensis]
MMGKQSGKKKKSSGDSPKPSNSSENSPKTQDKDTEVFIAMAHELKDEGNKLFQKRDHGGAMLKYEKALRLLPRNHIDVSYLRSNMAACYMQMGLSEYPRAINECNLALEVTPKYSKALLKRAKCYEALNRLDLALRDVGTVLNMEPNNIMALEVAERVKDVLEKKGLRVNDTVIELPPDYVEPSHNVLPGKLTKFKCRKKKGNKDEEKKVHEDNTGGNTEDKIEQKKAVEIGEEKKSVGIEPSHNVLPGKLMKLKSRKKKGNKDEGKKVHEDNTGGNTEDKIEEKKAVEIGEQKKSGGIGDVDKDLEIAEEKKAEVKVVVEEKITTTEEVPKRSVKLVLGEDIRWAQLPVNCTLLQLREVIRDRFPRSRAVLIKYRDEEGDLVTITTNEELRWAEESAESEGSVRLYIIEVSPDQDPFFQELKVEAHKLNYGAENGTLVHHKDMKGSYCIEDWIIDFAQLFKNYAGFESDAYLDLHELGMKFYSEAMEETVTSEEAQDIFDTAGEKFQEMGALALFNWGNVHMARARKKVLFTEDSSKESIISNIKTAYEWAQKEYTEAGRRYEEALHIKPDFYESYLALGQQQFEQAKLSWYYAISSNVDLETWPSTEVLRLYNKAEDNMEKGMQLWEESEEQRLSELSSPTSCKTQLQKMGLDGIVKDISADEAAEQATNMRSQINLLWGTMLYERSIVEFKLGLPVWHECLEVAVEKFGLAGASPTDIAVMVKNHSSNDNALEGLGFKIDEIIQAWNEMYEAKKWQSGIPSFRLEPLLRRRVSKLHFALENALKDSTE